MFSSDLNITWKSIFLLFESNEFINSEPPPPIAEFDPLVPFVPLVVLVPVGLRPRRSELGTCDTLLLIAVDLWLFKLVLFTVVLLILLLLALEVEFVELDMFEFEPVVVVVDELRLAFELPKLPLLSFWPNLYMGRDGAVADDDVPPPVDPCCATSTGLLP